MKGTVHYETRGDIALMTIDNPPVNPLSGGVRQGLYDGVEKALADDAIWPASLDEVNRVLKPEGEFVFLDGVWSKRRLISRLFWRLDAGQHPRTAEHLTADISSRFDVVDDEKFTLVHHAILLTARPTG